MLLYSFILLMKKSKTHLNNNVFIIYRATKCCLTKTLYLAKKIKQHIATANDSLF